jgi:hypothetical protein
MEFDDEGRRFHCSNVGVNRSAEACAVSLARLNELFGLDRASDGYFFVALQ